MLLLLSCMCAVHTEGVLLTTGTCRDSHLELCRHMHCITSMQVVLIYSSAYTSAVRTAYRLLVCALPLGQLYTHSYNGMDCSLL
jgi:hypothetical protein